MPSAPAIDVIPTGAALGAEILGVDLRSIDDATFRALYQAWLDHSVVLVRGQQLSDDDLIAFEGGVLEDFAATLKSCRSPARREQFLAQVVATAS